jgi:DEAD/DEAH box helicase domain-containing protein
MHVSCSSCGIEDLLEFSKNYDEVFLEFLSRFDDGLVSENGISENLKDEGIVRDENEIKKMIGKNKPDIITEAVLYSKKDYISEYKILKNPEPKMGCKVDEMGLESEVTKYLKKIQISQFYKFQEEAIKEIVFGENVIIEAPTASGKTEAFLIPVIQKIKNSSIETSSVHPN